MTRFIPFLVPVILKNGIIRSIDAMKKGALQAALRCEKGKETDAN